MWGEKKRQDGSDVARCKIWLQSRDTDETTKPRRSKYYTPEVRVFIINKKNEKQHPHSRTHRKKEKRRRTATVWDVFRDIALDSPESAAKRLVLMKNMTDGVSRPVPCAGGTIWMAFKRKFMLWNIYTDSKHNAPDYENNIEWWQLVKQNYQWSQLPEVKCWLIK